jgi:hypothetical protein
MLHAAARSLRFTEEPGLLPPAPAASKGPLKKKKKKQGGVGRLFLRGIAFFWPIL